MRRALLLAVALAASTAGPQAKAQPAQPQVTAGTSAFLNISPKRLRFDGSRRNGEIYILNQGTEPVTVDISLVDRVMLPDGQIFAADEAATRPGGAVIVAQLKSAKDLLQVSPRRVVLQPGRPQTIRVRLATTPEAGGGERRSHLTITTLPPRDSGETAESAAAGVDNRLRFQITAVYGLSAPIIVRSGENDARAAIDGAHVEAAAASGGGPAGPILALDLVRLGASSVYGDLEVRIAGDRKDAEPLGAVRGVAVYPEIERRAVRIPLRRPLSPGEHVEVTFTDDDASPGKVLAKITL